MLKNYNTINLTTLAKKLDIGQRSLSRYIKTLKEKQIIQRIGSDKTGYWKVSY